MTERVDAWTGRLSEVLDGDLDAAERAAFEAHLQGCPACARDLERLRAVVERAAALEPRAPEEDLWPAIAARLAAPRRTRVFRPAAWQAWRPPRWSLSLPQLAAAAVLLVAITSAAMWLVLSRPAPRTLVGGGPGAAPDAATPAVTASVPAGFEVQRYDAAIAELERTLREHRDELDPATVRVIERNLRIIDQATEQARRALAADPASPYLNGHLAAQLRIKVDLLRQATALVTAHG